MFHFLCLHSEKSIYGFNNIWPTLSYFSLQSKGKKHFIFPVLKVMALSMCLCTCNCSSVPSPVASLGEQAGYPEAEPHRCRENKQGSMPNPAGTVPALCLPAEQRTAALLSLLPALPACWRGLK